MVLSTHHLYHNSHVQILKENWKLPLQGQLLVCVVTRYCREVFPHRWVFSSKKILIWLFPYRKKDPAQLGSYRKQQPCGFLLLPSARSRTQEKAWQALFVKGGASWYISTGWEVRLAPGLLHECFCFCTGCSKTWVEMLAYLSALVEMPVPPGHGKLGTSTL